MIGDSGFVDTVSLDASPASIDRIWSTDFGTGGGDTISAGDGSDVIVGGDGGDTITAGNGRKLVAGDSVRIDRSAASTTPLFGNLPLAVGRVRSLAPTVGGDDVITLGTGDDIAVGGIGSDTITIGNGSNVVVGDNGLVVYDGLVDTTIGDASTLTFDSNPATLDFVATINPEAGGGTDLITTGSGNDTIIGGVAGDAINAGNGNNIVFGDSGLID